MNRTFVVLVTSVLAAASSPAIGADATAYLAKCQANVTRDRASLPKQMKPEGFLEYCACIAREAGTNQAVLDEFLTLNQKSVATARTAKLQMSAAAQAVGQKCNRPMPAEVLKLTGQAK